MTEDHPASQEAKPPSEAPEAETAEDAARRKADQDELNRLHAEEIAKAAQERASREFIRKITTPRTGRERRIARDVQKNARQVSCHVCRRANVTLMRVGPNYACRDHLTTKAGNGNTEAA